VTTTADGPTGGLPAPEPHVSLDTKPYWEGAAEGRLMLTKCPTCDRIIWYPKAICVDCGGVETEWIEASGRGTIYSYSVTHRPNFRYKTAGPYVLAYVELEEGPRMLTNIVVADPASLYVGQSVTVVFHGTGQGTALPRFRPV
jgi:uncharacterized protein